MNTAELTVLVIELQDRIVALQDRVASLEDNEMQREHDIEVLSAKFVATKAPRRQAAYTRDYFASDEAYDKYMATSARLAK